MIRTKNLTIDPELCKRLDKAVYHNPEPPTIALEKHGLYKAELLELIRSHNVALADSLTKHIDRHGLYYLCCLAERVLLDESAHVNERMHANMQTAHNQLKNWK